MTARGVCGRSRLGHRAWGGAGRGRGARSRTEMERVGGGTGREGWKGDLGGGLKGKLGWQRLNLGQGGV